MTSPQRGLPVTAESSVLSTRVRLVHEAAALLERQGYQATGVKQIARAAEATMSSLYHHFPGGKEELAVAALAHAGEQFAALLRRALDRESDASAAIAACALDLADDLASTEWAEACPVAVTALESVSDSTALRAAAAGILRGWITIIADRLIAAGLPAATAHDLATTTLSALEGAELIARTTAEAAPLHSVARQLARLVDLELAAKIAVTPPTSPIVPSSPGAHRADPRPSHE